MFRKLLASIKDRHPPGNEEVGLGRRMWQVVRQWHWDSQPILWGVFDLIRPFRVVPDRGKRAWAECSHIDKNCLATWLWVRRHGSAEDNSPGKVRWELQTTDTSAVRLICALFLKSRMWLSVQPLKFPFYRCRSRRVFYDFSYADLPSPTQHVKMHIVPSGHVYFLRLLA